jgi:hypothetical protein
MELAQDGYQPVTRTIEIHGGSPDAPMRVGVDFVREKIAPRPGKVVPTGESEEKPQ